MPIQQVIAGFDIDLFRAKTHFNLRHNSISSDNWEKAIADATNSRWIKGSADLADAYNKHEAVSISVKSRKFDFPTTLVGLFRITTSISWSLMSEAFFILRTNSCCARM